MFWLITSIIVIIVAFVGLGLNISKEGYEYTVEWKLRGRQALALLGVILCIPGFFAKIPANSVGVMYSPFGGTRDTTLTEGMHGKNIFDKVYKISTEVQTATLEGLTTQTKDAQYVTTKLDVKYSVDPTNAYLVFKQFKSLDKMSDSLIAPTAQRVLELVTTHYNVIDILGEKRSEVYSEFEMDLRVEFANCGVDLYSVSITDMDAGEAIETAIANEAIAKQDVKTAEERLKEAEINAKQKSVDAQADQDAAKIKSDTKIIEAEAEKKANDLLNQSLTDEVLQKEWIEKWNGQMPSVYGGDDLGIMVNP